MTILIVEDSELDRRLAETAIGKKHQVRSCHTLGQARCLRGAFDVVILDGILPDADLSQDRISYKAFVFNSPPGQRVLIYSAIAELCDTIPPWCEWMPKDRDLDLPNLVAWIEDVANGRSTPPPSPSESIE